VGKTLEDWRRSKFGGRKRRINKLTTELKCLQQLQQSIVVLDHMTRTEKELDDLLEQDEVF